MSAKLYELCPTCGGTGYFADALAVQHQCVCQALRVAETGLTVAQAEAAVRDLARARLRMAGLEKELKDWYVRAFEGAAHVDPVALTVTQAVAWWRSASPADQIAFTGATGLRLGTGGVFIHERVRGTPDAPSPKGE
jgi:hypothetical protein